MNQEKIIFVGYPIGCETTFHVDMRGTVSAVSHLRLKPHKSGIKMAKKKGICCSIAIVDESGCLLALHRMDGAPIPTVDIARDKAWTAAVFRLPSSEISVFGNPKAPGFGFNTQNWNDRLTPIP